MDAASARLAPLEAEVIMPMSMSKPAAEAKIFCALFLAATKQNSAKGKKCDQRPCEVIAVAEKIAGFDDPFTGSLAD